MKNTKALPSLIYSKMHRPRVERGHVYRQRLLDQLDQHIKRPLTLVSAPAGYGKTALVSCWLELNDHPSAWVSLDEKDNDLRLFLSYLLTAIQDIFPDMGRQTLTMVNAAPIGPVTKIIGSLINEINRIEQPVILVLDDFHLIKDESVLEVFNQLLRYPTESMHLVLVCRRDPPLPISRLRARGLVTEIRTQDLRFREMETTTFLTQELGIQVELSTAALLEKKVEGWVTGLRLAALSMRHLGVMDPKLLEPQVDVQYVMEYLFNEVFAKQRPEIIRFLINTAILDRFCGPLCEAVCMPGADPSTCEISGWDFIAWLKKENLFLIPLDAENRWFRFHHLFQKLLVNQLKRHRSPKDINVLHDQASAWFAENGQIEEALEHTLAGGNSKAATQLIAKHGFNLMNDEQWPHLERWLRMLPGELVDQEPELLVLMSWLHMIYARYSELVSCLDKAEALLSTRTAMEHIQGHLDALRGFQQYTGANGERALAHARRAREIIPRNHRWAQIFSCIIQAGAHQMLGDREKALSTIEEAMRDPDLRSGISQGYFQANPCFIYWIDADLTSLQQTAAQSLKLDENSRVFPAIAHGLYFMGIAHYERNDLLAAEDNLVAVMKDPYSQHTLNFAHSAFALALVHQALGREDEANQVGGAVVSFALDMKNPDVLHVARAFQAELALRQRRLGEASYWAERFVAETFAPTYRFYVPQLTKVKVLLAQDTRSSREQAADLLKRFYDFVVSTHSTRFQIDALTLKALLFDSQKNEPAALMALTEALTLAEPGGFIRVFVDLGPQMAYLLKRLINQNVSVGYIGKILAAFREDEQRAIQVESPPPKTQSPPLSTQFLVEPMTKREEEILNLLAQRLSNKEIADKLFISPETVKKHLNNIYGKLGVSKRLEAVEKAVAMGILTQH
ncbi:LuxR C-terminal-related transcriptional regulator [Thermodesulfobacteriota bacterium]